MPRSDEVALLPSSSCLQTSGTISEVGRCCQSNPVGDLLEWPWRQGSAPFLESLREGSCLGKGVSASWECESGGAGPKRAHCADEIVLPLAEQAPSRVPAWNRSPPGFNRRLLAAVPSRPDRRRSSVVTLASAVRRNALSQTIAGPQLRSSGTLAGRSFRAGKGRLFRARRVR